MPAAGRWFGRGRAAAGGSPRIFSLHCVTCYLQISFEVLYGNKSFSIVEDYSPFPDTAVLGAYNKTVEEPFGKLLKLPTVFVNVSDDGQGGVYDFAVMCVSSNICIYVYILCIYR